MGLGGMAALVLALFQSEEERQAIQVCENYFSALKKGDMTAAAECLHPNSLRKMRSAILKPVASQAEEIQEQVAAKFGYAGWKELQKAGDADFFTHFLKNIKDFGRGAQDLGQAMGSSESKLVGTLKKGDLVYAVFEMKMQVSGEEQMVTALEVLYRDGDKWRLAYRGETNIGK